MQEAINQTIQEQQCHERSKVIEERTRFGDFENDTIVSKTRKAGIVTVVDRTTRALWMKTVDGINAKT